MHSLHVQDGGAQRFILDLRSNPGGLVKAGVDVAALWLDGEREVFSVASRDPGLQVRVGLSVSFYVRILARRHAHPVRATTLSA